MKTNKLGILSIKLQNQPLDINIIKLVEDISNTCPDKEICIFNSYCNIALPNKVPVLHLVHAKFFYGDLIITDMVSALMSQKFPNIQNIYFYSNTIPWINQQNTMYSQWDDLINSDKIKIIASNQQIYDIFTICYKQPIGISENLKYEELDQLI